MNIFEKGNYQEVESSFRLKGLLALEELRKFRKN